MCVSVSTVDQMFIGVIQHPQLRLVSALVQQRTQQAEVGNDLAGFSLREVVRQLQGTHLSVVRKTVATAGQDSDL